jgi:non-heme Fe2+,alpha-ketoglutarate-dependent halogenase
VPANSRCIIPSPAIALRQTGPHRRIGLGVSYIPAHVRTIGSHQLPALLVRGHDRFGHFDLLSPPRNELDPVAIERHEQVYRRYRLNYAEQTELHDRSFAAA